VPVGALALVFLLQLFFPWVGIYVGGTAIATQGPWGAALAILNPEKSKLNDEFSKYLNEEKMKDAREDKKNVEDPRPGVSFLMLFYVLLFIPTLLVTAAVAALPFVKAPLPPALQQFLPWRWAAVAGINAVVLLFLGLQMVLNFSLENSVAAHVKSLPTSELGSRQDSDDVIEARREMKVNMVHRTVWLKLAFVLHILGTAAAALVFWIDKRGPSQPTPALELKW
jgi:hypothetical protein